MNNSIMYQDFLVDFSVYAEAEQFWIKYFERLLSEKWSPKNFKISVGFKALDGTPFRDEDICNVDFPELNKLVLIVQCDSEKVLDAQDITAWTGEVGEPQCGDYKKYIKINLVLKQNILPIVNELIKHFVQKNLTDLEVNEIIQGNKGDVTHDNLIT